jgi:GNAT superfamily N-acetyltransferase
VTEISIRAARWDDWPTIADFNCRLAMESEHKRLDPEKIVPGVQALLRDAQKGRYFVAEDGVGGPLVGQIMHTHEWSDWRNGPIWWLQSVYVTREFRQRGVFRALFEHLVQLAEAEKVLGVRLYVERENARAHQTYEKLGFADAGYFVMERWFGPSL